MKLPKKITLAAMLLSLTVMLCGCRVGNLEIIYLQDIWPGEVFKIGKEVCTKKEARVYLTNYRNIYGESYGMDLWQDSSEKSLESYTKEKALTQMAKIKCRNGLAKEKNVELTKGEKKTARNAAKKYYQSLSKKEKKYLDVKESDLEEMYEEYLLAAKVYDVLTKDVNTEISEDEARVVDVMQIFVSDKAKAEELGKRIQNGEDFAALAGSYNEKGLIQTSVGRQDVSKEVQEQVFELENDQITQMIPVKGGYYFAKCINKYDRDLTEQNKEALQNQRRQAAFDKEYQAYMNDVSKVLNKSQWNKMKLNAPKGITTDCFFEVIDSMTE